MSFNRFISDFEKINSKEKPKNIVDAAVGGIQSLPIPKTMQFGPHGGPDFTARDIGSNALNQTNTNPLLGQIPNKSDANTVNADMYVSADEENRNKIKNAPEAQGMDFSGLDADARLMDARKELARDPSKKDIAKTQILNHLGATEDDVHTPGKDGKSANDLVQDTVHGLRRLGDSISRLRENVPGAKNFTMEDLREMAFERDRELKAQLKLLAKDPKDYDKQEGLAMGLLFFLPVIMGAMAGGTQGLAAGLAGGISSVGKMLEMEKEEGKIRFERFTQLQNLRSQAFGDIRATMSSGTRTKDEEDRIRDNALRIEQSERLGLDLSLYSREELAKIRAVGDVLERANSLKTDDPTTGEQVGVDKFGGSIVKLRTPAAVTILNPEKMHAFGQGIGGVRQAEIIYNKMQRIVIEGQDLASRGALSKTWMTQTERRLDGLNNELISAIKLMKQFGQNFTEFEGILARASTPDVVGPIRSFEDVQTRLDRIDNAKEVMSTFKSAMEVQFGLEFQPVKEESLGPMPELPRMQEPSKGLDNSERQRMNDISKKIGL